MRHYKTILIAFLLGVTVFSVFRYIHLLEEMRVLMDNLEEDKIQIEALRNEERDFLKTIEQEKLKNYEIIQKNKSLKENIRASTRKITMLSADYERRNNELLYQISALQSENIAISARENKLKSDLALVSRQKLDLSERFSSISELKKAIRELKKDKGKNRHIIVESPKKITAQRSTEGNQGFLMKNGMSISTVKVKIEVNPALKNE